MPNRGISTHIEANRRQNSRENRKNVHETQQSWQSKVPRAAVRRFEEAPPPQAPMLALIAKPTRPAPAFSRYFACATLPYHAFPDRKCKTISEREIAAPSSTRCAELAHPAHIERGSPARAPSSYIAAGVRKAKRGPRAS